MFDTKEILLSFHSVRFVHLDTPIPTARFRNYLGKDELITLFGLAKHTISGYSCTPAGGASAKTVLLVTPSSLTYCYSSALIQGKVKTKQQTLYKTLKPRITNCRN